MKRFPLFTLFFFFITFHAVAQVSTSCVGSIPTTMIPPANSVTCGPVTVASNNSSTPPVLEYIVTDPNTIADDYTDGTPPVAQMLGPVILGTSTTTTINPSTYGVQAGEQFTVTAVNYDLVQVQNLIDDLYNNRVLFVPCCTLVDVQYPGLCQDLMAAGISQGSDIQNLNDLLVVFDVFNPVPGSSSSIEGFIGRINELNDNASSVPGACGGNELPICYAIDQGNVATYDYQPVPTITSITDNCPTSTTDVIVAAEVAGGSMQYSLDGSSWQSSNILTASTPMVTVYVRETTCLGQSDQEYTIPCAIAPLPVELISFSGEVLENGNLISWSTASEFRHDRFELERSVDGETFEGIASVAGQRNVFTESQYVQMDPFVFKEAVYYRLTSVDIDQKMTHSEVIVLSRQPASSPFSLTLQPNPAKDFIQLNWQTTNSSTVRRTVFNSTGLLMSTHVAEYGRGAQQQQLNLRDFPKGIYWLRLDNGQHSISQKFIVN